MPEQEKRPEQALTLNQRLKEWARKLKGDVIALYFALKHPATPLYAKVVTAIVVGYALSPIDLVPDFVPVLGYLDEVILLPLGIALAIKLIPIDVLTACREKARTDPPAIKPKIWAAVVVIVFLWLAIVYAVYAWLK